MERGERGGASGEKGGLEGVACRVGGKGASCLDLVFSPLDGFCTNQSMAFFVRDFFFAARALQLYSTLLCFFPRDRWGGEDLLGTWVWRSGGSRAALRLLITFMGVRCVFVVYLLPAAHRLGGVWLN